MNSPSERSLARAQALTDRKLTDCGVIMWGRKIPVSAVESAGLASLQKTVSEWATENARPVAVVMPGLEPEQSGMACVGLVALASPQIMPMPVNPAMFDQRPDEAALASLWDALETEGDSGWFLLPAGWCGAGLSLGPRDEDGFEESVVCVASEDSQTVKPIGAEDIEQAKSATDGVFLECYSI